MVRVVSQNFSPPRSRHSSGETDWDLAERADSALSALGKKRFELGLSEYESSSDSYWDSELDLEHPEDIHAKIDFGNDDINGNESSKKSDVHSRRKERRRERNKLSAQAYRKRKRHMTNTNEQELFIQEEKNKHLKEVKCRLEKEIEKAKMHLRGISVPASDHPQSDAGKDCVQSIPVSTLPPAGFAEEEAAVYMSHHVNLNVNENLLHQTATGVKSTAVEFLKMVAPTSTEGATASNASDHLDLPNANVASLTPILINANTHAGANNNIGTNSFPTFMTIRSLVPVKSKHGYYNANMNYKNPILRPSTLQTVPEIPSCLFGEFDDNIVPTSATEKSNPSSEGVANLAPKKEEECPCDSMKMAFSHSNSNMNLNKSKCEYNANDNFRQMDTNNCDNHIQMNSFQLMNINGNLNQNSLAAKQEVYP